MQNEGKEIHVQLILINLLIITRKDLRIYRKVLETLKFWYNPS